MEATTARLTRQMTGRLFEVRRHAERGDQGFSSRSFMNTARPATRAAATSSDKTSQPPPVSGTSRAMCMRGGYVRRLSDDVAIRPRECDLDCSLVLKAASVADP